MKFKKCLMLLPTTFNDGSSVPQETLDGILADIDSAFDGHSIEGYVHGAYKMADGTMAYDVSLRVSVAVQSDQMGDLRNMARRFASRLKQESLWFEVTDAEVEFLAPLDEETEDTDE